MVGVGRGAVEQELPGIELHLHIGELPLNALELAQRPAELAARQGMLPGGIETVTAESERPGSVADALGVEGGDLLLESARAQQHVFGADITIVEKQRHPGIAVHEARGLAEREAGRAALDQHRAETGDARAVADINEEQVRFRAEGGEHLAAVDAEAVAVGRGAGFEVGDRRSGFRLGHGDGDDLFAREQAGEVALFVVVGGVFGEGADGAEIADLHDVGAARAGQRDQLDRQNRVHQRPTLAAVAFRNHDPEQAGRGHLSGDIPGKAVDPRPFQRARGERALGEATHAVGEHPLSRSELKVHRLSSVDSFRGAPALGKLRPSPRVRPAQLYRRTRIQCKIAVAAVAFDIAAAGLYGFPASWWWTSPCP